MEERQRLVALDGGSMPVRRDGKYLATRLRWAAQSQKAAVSTLHDLVAILDRYHWACENGIEERVAKLSERIADTHKARDRFQARNAAFRQAIEAGDIEAMAALRDQLLAEA